MVLFVIVSVSPPRSKIPAPLKFVLLPETVVLITLTPPPEAVVIIPVLLLLATVVSVIFSAPDDPLDMPAPLVLPEITQLVILTVPVEPSVMLAFVEAFDIVRPEIVTLKLLEIMITLLTEPLPRIVSWFAPGP